MKDLENKIDGIKIKRNIRESLVFDLFLQS